jgi:hypothetical protein
MKTLYCGLLNLQQAVDYGFLAKAGNGRNKNTRKLRDMPLPEFS